MIRLSGDVAIQFADTYFRGKKKLSSVASHTVHLGNIVDGNENVIDEVLVTIFIAPNSYTGENVVEISCHGSVFVTNKILENFLNHGARLAEPGEFTKRAFLSGKMDLSQAEAVADLIHSRAEASHQSSLKQLKGALSERIHAMRDKLLNICSLIELELDFSEEDVRFVEREKSIDEIGKLIAEMELLVASFEQGKLIRDGVKVVICGEPNVGKSSLLNALLDEDRAIVTDISGTTRDVIEESIKINGIVFRLVDTAGLRETVDVIEREGIRRTENEIQEADVLLLVDDILLQEQHADINTVRMLLKNPNHKQHLIVVKNKVDLVGDTITTIRDRDNNSILVSAKTKQGVTNLKRKLYETTIDKSLHLQEKSIAITNIRHRNLIKSTIDYLVRGLDGLQRNISGDFIAVDFRIALNTLGEITGEVTTEDILNNIFSKFCIGK